MTKSPQSTQSSDGRRPASGFGRWEETYVADQGLRGFLSPQSSVLIVKRQA